MDTFSAEHFRDDDAARKFLESTLWPEGPVCPHCGVINHAYATNRPGVYRCAEPECRKDFTVTMRTVMERSKIALHKWLQAFYLMCASKKGVSAHQLHRQLDIGYEAAWFMCHRIREAMRDGGLAPLGGEGAVVEADETYFGPTEERRPSPARGDRPFTKGGKTGPANKRAIVSLVERGGSVRSFHVAVADQATVENIVSTNHCSRDNVLPHRRKPALRARRCDVRFTRNGEAHRPRVRPWRREHQLGRRLLLNFQAGHEGHLPALPGEAPAPLPSRSTTSATTTALLSASPMGNVRRSPYSTRPASVSRIGGLVSTEFKFAAARFLRWRRKNWNPPKRKIRRIWCR